ncbi:hypothetical protein EBZ39_14060 [bacterium]|nr:hypothetical protein [bacterium]
MDANAVATNYPDEFGNRRLALKQTVSLAATGDVTTLVVQEATKFIVRRITLSNFSGSATTTNVGVFTAASGGGTAIAADQALGATAVAGKFDDLTLATGANENVQTARVLYVRVSTGNVAVTCDIALYGDIVAL